MGKSFLLYFHPLNFIRFVLACGVLLFHYGLNYFPFDQPALKTLIEHSSFRVSFFFFISGFVMSLVYGRGEENLSPKYFYKKRLSRIFPVYWLAFVFTVLVVLFVKGAAPKGLVIVMHALGLQSWMPGYVLDLNFTTWSVSVELFFYALFPFLLNWMRNIKVKMLLVIALFVWILQSLQHYYFVNHLSDGSKVMEEFISSFPLWHLGTFFLGMITAKFILLEIIPNGFSKIAPLFFLIAVLLFAWVIYVPNPVLKYIHNGLLAPLYAMLILSLFYDRSIFGRLLGARVLSNLGNLSYGIFIFQYPVWVIFNHVFDEITIKTTAFFWYYFLAVLLLSFLANKFYEKPLLAYLRRNKS